MNTQPTSGHGAPGTHENTLKLYYTVYGALMLLLVLTVGAAYLKVGAWALPIALTIAVIKSILVIIYFMLMRFTPKLMWLWFSIGFVWLCMMIFGITTDVIMRMH